KLVVQYPGVWQYREALADSHRQQGVIFKGNEQRTEAGQAFRRAQSLYEKLAAEFPNHVGPRARLVALFREIANLHAQDVGKAEEPLRKALGLIEKLSADFPEQTAYLNSTVGVLNEMADLLNKSKRLPETEAAYRRAVALGETLALKRPDWRPY